jgi:hypothetical protein
MKPSRRARRIVRLLSFFALILIAGSWVFYRGDRSRNEVMEYEVYSAYLSEGILNDAHDWSVDAPIQVVIADTTSSEHLRRVFGLSRRVDLEQLEATTEISFVFRNLFQTPVPPGIHLPQRAMPVYVSSEAVHLEDIQDRFPNSMGYVVLCGVGFNFTHTQALFYIDHVCGLCGGGRYVLMEKANGSWHVRNEHYTWIS